MLRCFECDSTKHLVSSCPHRSDKSVSDTNQVHITLFASSPDDRQYCLIGETLSRGVLDSGCTKTVAGEFWMNEYLGVLSEKQAELVETNKSNATYRFGDGKESAALKNVKTPVSFGNKTYMMSVDVVKNDIPLLISKQSMKSLGMRLNFGNDTAEVSGKSIPLMCSATGHYYLPLTSWDLEDSNNHFTLHASHIRDIGRAEKLKKAMKLHRQFAHASKEKLIKLVKESKEFNDKEFIKCIEEYCDSCEICRKYKRPYHKPIVGMPIANEFNEVLCMDLKEYKHNKVWILHLIDAATRYFAAC